VRRSRDLANRRPPMGRFRKFSSTARKPLQNPSVPATEPLGSDFPQGPNSIIRLVSAKREHAYARQSRCLGIEAAIYLASGVPHPSPVSTARGGLWIWLTSPRARCWSLCETSAFSGRRASIQSLARLSGQTVLTTLQRRAMRFRGGPREPASGYDWLTRSS